MTTSRCGAERGGAADPAGRRSRRARRRAALRGLRRHLFRADGRTAARGAQPDVHCKGLTTRSTPCPSATSSRRYGGRIAIVGDPKDHSTRDLLARIACRSALNPPPRFLIVRLGSLGDVIHGIPVAAALRRPYPHARIDWLVDPRYVELLDLVECLDRRVPFDPRDLWAAARAWADAARAAAHALRRGDRSAGAAQVSGPVAPRPRAADDWISASASARAAGAALLHRRRPIPVPPPTSSTRTWRCSRRSASRSHVRFPIAIPRTPRCVDRRARRSGGYALINPGAAWPNKRWPPEGSAPSRGDTRDSGCVARLVGTGRGGAGRRGGCRIGGRRRPAPPTTITDLVGIARAGAADGVGRYRAAAHCRRRRHADRGAVRTDVSRAQRSMVAARRRRVARGAVRLPLRAALPQGAPCIDDIASTRVMDAVAGVARPCASG